MFVENPDGTLGQEIPFFQIGAEQGFLPKVAMISTGFAMQLPGDGTIPPKQAAPDPDQALLMGLAGVKALFDVDGLYVWHCHIVEHEDNEMMRPYFVGQ